MMKFDQHYSISNLILEINKSAHGIQKLPLHLNNHPDIQIGYDQAWRDSMDAKVLLKE